MKLTYNLADGEDYVFQTSLSGALSHIPTRWSRKAIFDSGQKTTAAPIVATDRNSSKSSSPVLDVYFSRNLPKSQNIVFNAVGTYIHTTSMSSYNEGGNYAYDVKGRTYSFMSEGIYERKIKPLTFSMGINYKQKYTKNEYTGSTTALNNMHNSRLYLFADATGAWNDFRYSVGVGVSYLHH